MVLAHVWVGIVHKRQQACGKGFGQKWGVAGGRGGGQGEGGGGQGSNVRALPGLLGLQCVPASGPFPGAPTSSPSWPPRTCASAPQLLAHTARHHATLTYKGLSCGCTTPTNACSRQQPETKSGRGMHQHVLYAWPGLRRVTGTTVATCRLCCT